MPESRKANKVVRCSFCNEHKDTVPLLITSISTDSAICSWCALGVVNQTFQHVSKLEHMLRQMMEPPKVEVVHTPPDALDSAIGKALNK